MTTTPEAPVPEDGARPDADPTERETAAGVELGMSEDTGGTFEPEEDPPTGD